MVAKPMTIQPTPCSSPLPDLEVPMISTMVGCLSSEHKKLNGLGMQLALAATRVISDPGAISANQRALRGPQRLRADAAGFGSDTRLACRAL